MSLDEAYRARISGNYQEALDLYRSILASSPENATAYEGAAACLSNLRDYIAASNLAKRALELDSSLVYPHLVLADVYHHERKHGEAEAEINKAIELQPNSAAVIYAQGVNLIWKNKFDDALVFFMKAVETDSNSPVAFSSHLNLGYIYQQKRDFRQALHEYRFAYNLRPSRRLLLIILGIKYRWIISIILTVLLFAILGLGIVLNNGLLIALFLLPLFIVYLAITVRYFKEKKIFWVFVAGSISLIFGWLIYQIIYTYFTK